MQYLHNIYTISIHQVVTTDGYVLTMHRIPRYQVRLTQSQETVS